MSQWVPISKRLMNELNDKYPMEKIIMKSLILALTLAFTVPTVMAQPATTPGGVKVAKKKEKKAAPAAEKQKPKPVKKAEQK